MRGSVLPLGLDIGSRRIRLARVERARCGKPRLMAVAAREVEDESSDEILAMAVEELAHEVGGRRRTCVLAMPSEQVFLAAVHLPKMGWAERRRAAAFEAARCAPWDVREDATVVRIRSIDARNALHALGLVRKRDLERRVAIVRRAGLRAVRVDHEGCALRRAFPSADAVLDVGLRRTTLHAFAAAGLQSYGAAIGGGAITRAIGSDLKIDAAMAEKRKRVLGTAGAGEGARRELLVQAGLLIERARAAAPIRRIALVGNGSRLPSVGAELESMTGCIVELVVSELLRDGEYPEDVLCAAAPDWALAAALARWGQP
ncbi:MAG TPA: pilus assembly protein PilM [Verrucomicrobiae bacterium]|nr:pilus assembly protein PilM [Verrucomicrobiae bacterium]